MLIPESSFGLPCVVQQDKNVHNEIRKTAISTAVHLGKTLKHDLVLLQREFSLLPDYHDHSNSFVFSTEPRIHQIVGLTYYQDERSDDVNDFILVGCSFAGVISDDSPRSAPSS